MQNQEILYLTIVRPASYNNLDEQRLKKIAEIVSSDLYTTRQKFLGKSLTVLCSTTDGNEAMRRSEALAHENIKTLILPAPSIKGARNFDKTSMVAISDNSLKFLNRKEEVILEINKGDEIILAVAPPNPTANTSSGASYLVDATTYKVEKSLYHLALTSPIMAIISPLQKKIALFETVAFDFNSLGDRKKLAHNLNFLSLIDLIKSYVKGVRYDFSLDGARLPYLEIKSAPTQPEQYREERLNVLGKYALYTLKASEGGLFEETVGEVREASPVEDIAKKRAIALSKANVMRGKKSISAQEQIKNMVRHFGAPYLFFPLILVGIAFIALALYFKASLLAYPGVALFGVALIIHFIVLLYRKRIIENAPTARARSVTIGFNELAGKAVADEPLYTPYSLTECAFYRYKVTRHISAEENSNDSLFPHSMALSMIFGRRKYKKTDSAKIYETGDSGYRPFYIEDETGKVMVDPHDAVIELRHKNTLSIPDPEGGPHPAKVEEELLPLGAPVYVFGFVQERSRKDRREERLENVAEQLRQLKSDPVALSKYDTNKDGRIDNAEWEEARQDAEAKALTDSITKRSAHKVELVVRASQYKGLFYITTEKEKKLLRRMTIRLVIAGIAGISLATAGIVGLLSAL